MNGRRAGASEAFRAADYLTGDTFTVRPTPAGWWVTTPVPDDLGKYYPPTYYGVRRRRFPGPIEWLQSWLYRRRARWVTRTAGCAGRVLDVGCGPGHLLARFRDLGWDVLGTEATAESAAIPRQRYGFEVRVGELPDLGLAPASFDAVVSWHTLEHMREPAVVLDVITRLLKPNGLLLVSVPDFFSPEAQAKPSDWFHLDVPRHLVHFPAEVLRRLLRERGLVIVAERNITPEYDVFSLVQTWQNRLGLPPNLLYLMIKSARAASGGRPAWAQQVAAVLLVVPMLALAALVTTWRGLTKSGAVVVLLARKR